MAKHSIPKITNKRLAELLKRISPLVRASDGVLCFIEPVDPRDVSFTWDPKLRGKAPEMRVLAKIRTLHTYGYHGMFKPSIAEVCAQIPKEYIGRVAAFEVSGPETADDLNREREALNAGFHVAETTLYEAIPEPTRRTVWEHLDEL